MVYGASIPDEDIVDLDKIPSRQKRMRYFVSHSKVIHKYESKNYGGSREIITPGVDLEDGTGINWLTMDIH